MLSSVFGASRKAKRLLKEKPAGSAKQMTEFGRTLYSFMLTRGIEHRQDLVRILKDNGYPISQARLTYYLNGERTVDPLFLACVSELLKLTKEERRRLAWAYGYGQLNLTEEQLDTIGAFKAVL
jgi:hypothetical protein